MWFDGSPCYTEGTFNGTVNGTALTGNDSSGTNQIFVNGQISTTGLTGTFNVNGACPGAGSFMAHAVN
jgi:hypothetical protein